MLVCIKLLLKRIMNNPSMAERRGISRALWLSELALALSAARTLTQHLEARGAWDGGEGGPLHKEALRLRDDIATVAAKIEALRLGHPSGFVEHDPFRSE